MPDKKQLSDIEAKAISIVEGERDAWEDSLVYVTDKVAFAMRNLIKTLRKNYWGIFDEPTDPVTGRKKTWIPLSESLVESTVKNIDLDTKDINIRAKKPGSVRFASVVRNVVRNFLGKIMFGEILDISERQLLIDGTCVWKITEVKGKDGKPTADIRLVDTLNIYVDPTTKSLQDAYRVTERGLLSLDEIKGMKGWINTENLDTAEGLNPNDRGLDSTQSGTSKYRDVWEIWGMIPKWLITNDKKDKESGVEIDGHIVVSGLEANGKVVHLIEENKKSLKPYEECWFRRINGRWPGKGVVEAVMMLQVWLNTVVNIRINRSYVSQLGIFKIRTGAGITPQMVGRLASNGAILVKDMTDIEQMVMQDASPSSYKDEDIINSWSQKVSGAYDVSTGETLPASTSATSAAIQSNQANSGYILVKEGIGMFLQRVMERHVLPIIFRNLKKDELLRITGDVQELREFDNNIKNALFYKEIEKRNKKGEFVPLEMIEREMARFDEVQTELKDDRFIEIKDEFNPADYDVEVFVTNEEIDKSVLANNLLSALQLVPEHREEILEEIYDIMGLDVNRLKKKQTQMGDMLQQAQAPQPNMEDIQSLMTQANTQPTGPTV